MELEAENQVWKAAVLMPSWSVAYKTPFLFQAMSGKRKLPNSAGKTIGSYMRDRNMNQVVVQSRFLQGGEQVATG